MYPPCYAFVGPMMLLVAFYLADFTRFGTLFGILIQGTIISIL
jgi:hypothetical protein